MLRLLLLEREDGELSRLLVRLDEDLSRGGVFNRDELTIGGELAISGELALLDDLRGGRSRVCIGVWSCNDGDFLPDIEHSLRRRSALHHAIATRKE